jgi:2-iminobutanoate/2-iminopropanoate deaminase
MNKIVLRAVAVSAAAGLFLSTAFIAKDDKPNRKVIFTEDAPQPIGPYSQAILAGNTLYVAGQVGLNPATGKLDSTGIAGETRQALKNIYAVLLAANMNMSHIVKTTIYLKNVKDFEKVNKEYGTYFTNMAPPARETVGVADLPKGAQIEISVIAVK